MKRSYLLLLSFSLLVLSGPLAAQSQLYFGANGSILSTWTTNQMNYGKPDMDYKLTFNPSGNINIGYDFNKNFGLILAPGYAVLGQKYEDVINDTAYSRRVSMGYVVIPLMFKFRTTGDVARFYAMAGPQFNLLVKAKQDYFKNDDISTEQVYNQNLNDWVKVGQEEITDQFESFDIMARFEVGAEFTIIDNLFLTAGISMAYGLMDINAPDWQMENADGEYNPSHNLYGGLTFGINYCFTPKKGK
jgi:hypothetical protein